MRQLTALLLAGLATAWGPAASAQDANITLPVPELERMLANDPFTIVSAEISRPKAKGDITLKAEVSFDGGPPMRVKLRKAEPGADSFNNEPRYDLAAYDLQKLFLDPAEYVVPPTALRFVPLEEFAKYSPEVKRTFIGADAGAGRAPVLAAGRQGRRRRLRPGAVRHGPGLRAPRRPDEHPDLPHRPRRLQRRQLPDRRGPTVGARVFSMDNGVAFASDDSDRGTPVGGHARRPAAGGHRRARCAGSRSTMLQDRLGVVAQWKLKDGRFVPMPPGASLSTIRGVRRDGDDPADGPHESLRSTGSGTSCSACSKWSTTAA